MKRCTTSTSNTMKGPIHCTTTTTTTSNTTKGPKRCTKRLKRCTTTTTSNTTKGPKRCTKRLKRCTTTSSLPETILDYEDILTEILVRIPARPLLRFKCVSKHWLSFISDPKFCHLHTLRNSNSPTSAVFSGLSNVIGFIPLGTNGSPNCNPLHSIPNLGHDEFKVIQSCKGLFLCHPKIVLPPSIPISEIRLVTSPLYHYVLNPTTKQFTKLFPPASAAAPALTTKPRVLGHALAFDPSKSPHYKVLFILDLGPGRWCSYHYIEIYSSETKTWRLLNSSFESQPVNYREGVYCNGAVHWVGNFCEMAYFHIEEERVGLVDGFSYSEGKSWNNRLRRYFKESNDGHLRLIDIHFPCLTKFQVLEMGRDYCGWFVKYNVDLDPLCTAYPPAKAFSLLFLANEENEEESSSLLLNAPGKVFSYNLKSNTFKSIDLTPQAGVDDSHPRVGSSSHQYMETLACV